MEKRIVLGLHGSRRPRRGLLTMSVFYSAILLPSSQPERDCVQARGAALFGRVSKDGGYLICDSLAIRWREETKKLLEVAR